MTLYQLRLDQLIFSELQRVVGCGSPGGFSHSCLVTRFSKYSSEKILESTLRLEAAGKIRKMVDDPTNTGLHTWEHDELD